MFLKGKGKTSLMYFSIPFLHVWKQNENSTEEFELRSPQCMIKPTGSGNAESLEVHLLL